jgi:hypothetical protein
MTVLNKGTITSNRFDDNITKADLEQVGGFMATPKTHARFESTYELSSFRVLNELLRSTAMIGNSALLCLLLLVGVELNPGPSNRSRRVGRKSRSRNGQNRMVTALTPSQAFEMQLARTNDSFALRGKSLLFTSVSSASVTLVSNFTASSFGNRTNDLSLAFTRYRFKYIRFRVLPADTTTTTPSVVFGIVDDPDPSNPPTTINALMNARCSCLVFGGQTVPQEFTWKPVDPKKWYYITSGSSSSADPRFSQAANLYVGSGSTATASFDIEVDYSIVYAGANVAT